MDNRIIGEPVEYERIFQRGFATSRFGSPSEMRNIFLLASGDGGESCGLFVAHVLLHFIINVRRSSEIQEYAFMQYMHVTHLIDTVDETPGSVCLR